MSIYTYVSPTAHEAPGLAGMGPFIHSLTHLTKPSWELPRAGCYMVPVLMDLTLGKGWDIIVIVVTAPDDDNRPSYARAVHKAAQFNAQVY